MKRLTLILAAMLLLCAAGCGKKASAGVEETAVFMNPNAVKEGAYGALYFEADGYRFGIYDPMADLLMHVAPNTTFTGESCAVDGEDLYYFFNGFEVLANVIDGAERVTAITVTDDTVKTPDGLYIGMSETELTQITGQTPGVGGILTTADGTAERNITVQDGEVKAITYVPAE